MKKILSVLVGAAIFASNLQLTFAYTLTNDDGAVIDQAANRIEEMIASKGENYRSRYIVALKNIQSRSTDARVYRLLGATIRKLKNNDQVLLVQNSDVNNNQPVVKNDEVNKVQPAPENTTVSTGDPVVQDGDFIFLDYTARLEDGTVVDSTRLEDAKKIANYNPDVEYKPLSFTVGKEKMRAGFEKVVLGMKTGEKKDIKLAGSDAFGPTRDIMVPISSFQDRISEVISRELLNDTMTQVVSKSSLGQIGLDIRVGDMLISKDKSTAKVIKVEGDQVTIEFKNTLNPFYGKPLTVGLKGIFEGKEIVITKIDDKEVTVDVDNKANPFYGRPLTVGLTGTMPDGSSMTIIQISAENVLVEIPTPANLVGKTIILSVEIKSIQKASK